jgi:hypothetical protein
MSHLVRNWKSFVKLDRHGVDCARPLQLHSDVVLGPRHFVRVYLNHEQNLANAVQPVESRIEPRGCPVTVQARMVPNSDVVALCRRAAAERQKGVDYHSFCHLVVSFFFFLE